MKERPILFSGAMVRAILAGSKTQTRRVVKSFKSYVPAAAAVVDCVKDVDGLPSRVDMLGENSELCPYGEPGDRLWVKETWRVARGKDKNLRFGWVADDAWSKSFPEKVPVKWCLVHQPSIHMPRWASRITLEVVKVRVERLQDITEEDAKAEGCARFEDDHGGYSARVMFCELWESINGAGSWDLNPWVWVVEFKKVENS